MIPRRFAYTRARKCSCLLSIELLYRTTTRSVTELGEAGQRRHTSGRQGARGEPSRDVRDRQ